MINERIKELVQEICGGNKREFSRIINVSPTVIENIVGTRQGKPGYDVIVKILTSIANISPDWLLLDQGAMLRNSKPSTEAIVEGTKNITQISPIEESIMYRMYKEKDKENKELLMEIGRLNECIRQLENENNKLAIQQSVSS